MAYFRPFSNVISIETSCAAQKNTSNMAATVRYVIDDVTCKSSMSFDKILPKQVGYNILN
jgi:hypothetical protein